MGFEEYNLIKTTMLGVAKKTNSIEAKKSEIDGIVSRKRKNNAKIAKLRKDINEMNSEYNFDNETVERYESEIKSSELDLSRSDRNLKLFMIIFFISWFIAGPLTLMLGSWYLTVDEALPLFILIIMLPFVAALVPTLEEEESESHDEKITRNKNLLERFYSLPQEIEKLEKSISKENEEIKESDSEIEDLENEIETINSEISDMMDSIKHLIPYADKI